MTGTDLDNADWTDQSDSLAEQAALLEQFTQTLEEATWLRRLAQHFELRDVRHAVADVAAEVLPDLRQIVLAESIGLIPAHFLAAGNVAAEGLFQSVWDGPPHGDNVVLDLLCHPDLSGERPVIMNRSAIAGTPISEHGVHSLILMPVSSASFRIGWLVVLNRVAENAPMDLGHEVEFGTVEASLVQAAAAMLATHARNVALFEDKERLLIGVIGAMSGAVDARDPYTHGHSSRVATYARAIARQTGLGQRECERIYVGGLLHDIGKIGVPDAILKKEGKLTDEEFEIMKRHPETGHQILCQLQELSYVLPGVLHHHERVDGQGYPHGLAGDAIPLMARILAVADSYDAMTSSRPYREAMPSEKAERILRANAGTQWDASVVLAFFRCIDGIRDVVKSVPVIRER